MPEATARQVRELRDLSGMGLTDCVRILRIAAGAPFWGDVVLALCFVEAGSLAVCVKGDRQAWDLSRAEAMAPLVRERNPELDAAYPSPARA